MSKSTSAAADLHGPVHPPSTETRNNPFDTVFDDNETDDEWWEEDGKDPSNPTAEASAIRTAQWVPPTSTRTTAKSGNLKSTRRVDKRFSVQKPIREKSKGRQKKQNAHAGIKVVTDFSRHQDLAPPVLLQPAKPMPQIGCFVDLAALQALNGDPVQTSGGFWKSRKNKELTRAENTLPSMQYGASEQLGDTSHLAVSGKRKSKTLIPSPLKLSGDLSPNDRPIVIGISIPSANLKAHTFSPETASSERHRPYGNDERGAPTGLSPETPTIIITPAHEASIWSRLDENSGTSNSRARPASSIYSQAPRNNDISYPSVATPPVPQLPASILDDERQKVAAQRSYFSPDSDQGTVWEDDDSVHSVSQSRIMSTCTVFEEDESPVILRRGRAISVSAESNVMQRASFSTVATQRRSKGWWNYITTPFLTRSNTFAVRDIEHQNPPALPSLAIAAAKAQDIERDGKLWEKEFSPLTPQTSTTIASEPWWNPDSKHPRSAEQSPVIHETRHKVQTSTGTLPIVYAEAAALGISNTSTMASDIKSHHSRGNTTTAIDTSRVSMFSPTDREIPMFWSPDARDLQSNNPFTQPQTGDISDDRSHNESTSRQAEEPVEVAVVQSSQSAPTPPPPYSASPARVRKYRAVFPPGHTLGTQHPASPGPASPGPVSPGMQQAIASGYAMPMSTVPLTPPARRPINLNSGYPTLPPRENGAFFTSEHLEPSAKKVTKAEAKRQRHEKEDAVAHRAGGWWRGRGCISDRGCYGRSGPEGRKKRRWYLGLTIVFLSMMIVVVVLATQLHRKSNTTIEPSQWLNLTGFPPIFTGLSTIAAPINTVANTGCVFPATQWSCALPKELQSTVAPNLPNQPNFFFHIQWDNSSSTNTTFANVTGNPDLAKRSIHGGPVSARRLMEHLLLKARNIVTFTPTPEPPSFVEEFFLGNTTDGIFSDQKAGEPTPFYISLVKTANSTIAKRDLVERQTTNFPNLTSVIPAPSLDSDGTAAAANLVPFPIQQPIRLYDRGLPSEHYGFYTYYDRSIFLKSLDKLNQTNLDDGAVPDDKNGGSQKSEAKFRCTWTQTRFLVQMWTRKNTTSQLLNSTEPNESASFAADPSQQVSFPYPVTVTIDRHGGHPKEKLLFCYEMNNRNKIIKENVKINAENRGFGGNVINGAPTFFRNASNPAQGGFDGGSGGCSCQWKNFREVSRLGE